MDIKEASAMTEASGLVNEQEQAAEARQPQSQQLPAKSPMK